MLTTIIVTITIAMAPHSGHAKGVIGGKPYVYPPGTCLIVSGRGGAFGCVMVPPGTTSATPGPWNPQVR